jgi:hypothetical protein
LARAGDALAAGEHDRVGDQQHVGGVPGWHDARQQAHGHFGADAAGVAEQDRDAGLAGSGGFRGVISGQDPSGLSMLASRTSLP